MRERWTEDEKLQTRISSLLLDTQTPLGKEFREVAAPILREEIQWDLGDPRVTDAMAQSGLTQLQSQLRAMQGRVEGDPFREASLHLEIDPSTGDVVLETSWGMDYPRQQLVVLRDGEVYSKTHPRWAASLSIEATLAIQKLAQEYCDVHGIAPVTSQGLGRALERQSQSLSPLLFELKETLRNPLSKVVFSGDDVEIQNLIPVSEKEKVYVDIIVQVFSQGTRKSRTVRLEFNPEKGVLVYAGQEIVLAVSPTNKIAQLARLDRRLKQLEG